MQKKKKKKKVKPNKLVVEAGTGEVPTARPQPKGRRRPGKKSG
jgi:hypothetical protein